MQLFSPKELRHEIPLSASGQCFIAHTRQQICNIISGQDPRLAIVMGPCSIHDIPSAYEYATKLKALSLEVEKSCLLVMRVYPEKPRSRLGWKGLLHDPEFNGSDNIARGLYETRKLLATLADMQVATAAECVNPLAHIYFNDLLSWGFIGARTSASQAHRELASSVPMPVGFKNPTDGDLDTAVNGVVSAQHPHTFLSIDERGQIVSSTSKGNPFAHIVLRGSTERSNYDPDTIEQAVNKLLANGLPGRMMVDCAHGNCSGHYLRQKEVFLNLIERISQGEHALFGLMLESHLQSGNLLSKTDPCIDWETTEHLVYQAHNQLCSSISCC